MENKIDQIVWKCQIRFHKTTATQNVELVYRKRRPVNLEPGFLSGRLKLD